MKDEVEKLRQEALQIAILSGTAPGNQQAVADKIVALFQKAQVEAVRAELESLKFEGHTRKQIRDRLARLTKEDKESK